MHSQDRIPLQLWLDSGSFPEFLSIGSDPGINGADSMVVIANYYIVTPITV
jgi:hypothetical protein